MFSSTIANGCAGHDDELLVDNPEKGWGWLISNGADIIFTDHPLSLINSLKKKKLH